MLGLKIFVVIVFSAVTVFADLVGRIEVRTADCDDCGMSNTFGALRMQMCNSYNDCCFTSKLDEPFHDDFDEGATDIFEGYSILNECDHFDMRNSDPTSIKMSLLHEGTDGYQANYITFYTDTSYYKCYFSKFLDDEDYEDGYNCVKPWRRNAKP